MNKKQLIGREREARLLDDICTSGKAEFVAVYGRRRVGKTFLVDSYFQQQYDFFMAGMYEGNKSEQLGNFAHQKIKEQRNDLLTQSHSDTQEKQVTQPIRVEKKVDRNDPCPCGSGKKYKNCHGRMEGGIE